MTAKRVGQRFHELTEAAKRARWLAIGVLLTTAGGVAWILGVRVPRDADLAGDVGGSLVQASMGMMGSMAPLSVDPAAAPLEWAREGETVERPGEPPSLHALATDEASMEELIDLLEWTLPYGQGGAAGLEMARCAARFEPELDQQCDWEVRAVARRLTEDAGAVVYARADPTVGGHQPACAAMAACWLPAWAGREGMPMPARLGDEVAFTQGGRNSLWVPGQGVDATQRYRDGVAELQRALVELDASSHETTSLPPVSLRWSMLFARHHLDELQCMVDVLEDRAGACGT
jgi:hypothetical protein